MISFCTHLCIARLVYVYNMQILKAMSLYQDNIHRRMCESRNNYRNYYCYHCR